LRSASRWEVRCRDRELLLGCGAQQARGDRRRQAHLQVERRQGHEHDDERRTRQGERRPARPGRVDRQGQRAADPGGEGRERAGPEQHAGAEPTERAPGGGRDHHERHPAQPPLRCAPQLPVRGDAQPQQAAGERALEAAEPAGRHEQDDRQDQPDALHGQHRRRDQPAEQRRVRRPQRHAEQGGNGRQVRVRTPAVGALSAALSAAGLGVRPVDDSELLLEGADAERVGDLAHAHGIVVHGLGEVSGSLEQAYPELTGASVVHVGRDLAAAVPA
jgi:hypothetical protein